MAVNKDRTDIRIKGVLDKDPQVKEEWAIQVVDQVLEEEMVKEEDQVEVLEDREEMEILWKLSMVATTVIQVVGHKAVAEGRKEAVEVSQALVLKVVKMVIQVEVLKVQVFLAAEWVANKVVLAASQVEDLKAVTEEGLKAIVATQAVGRKAVQVFLAAEGAVHKVVQAVSQVVDLRAATEEGLKAIMVTQAVDLKVFQVFQVAILKVVTEVILVEVLAAEVALKVQGVAKAEGVVVHKTAVVAAQVETRVIQVVGQVDQGAPDIDLRYKLYLT